MGMPAWSYSVSTKPYVRWSTTCDSASSAATRRTATPDSGAPAASSTCTVTADREPSSDPSSISVSGGDTSRSEGSGRSGGVSGAPRKSVKSAVRKRNVMTSANSASVSPRKRALSSTRLSTWGTKRSAVAAAARTRACASAARARHAASIAGRVCGRGGGAGRVGCSPRAACFGLGMEELYTSYP